MLAYPQSNMHRQVLVCAVPWLTQACLRYAGLECHLILRNAASLVDQDPGLVGNLLVERLVGAYVHQVWFTVHMIPELLQNALHPCYALFVSQSLCLLQKLRTLSIPLLALPLYIINSTTSFPSPALVQASEAQPCTCCRSQRKSTQSWGALPWERSWQSS